MENLKTIKAIGIIPISNVGSIEILKIDETDEKIYYAIKCGERSKILKSKINYTDKGAYFVNRAFTATRQYLHEIIRA